tara:strand:- start:7289 stop:8269 length:981 start_codon:yes stop_codon:yes gene_type:complete
MAEPTDPKLVAADIEGSQLTSSINDFRRDKAVRKMVYFNPKNKQSLIDFITAETATAERYDSVGAQSAGGTLVHPEKVDLPLQTIDVLKVGRDKWIATLNYFRIASGGWGGSNARDILQMRTSLEPMRVYTDGKQGTPEEDDDDKDDPKGEGFGDDDTGTESGEGEFNHFWSYAIPGGSMIMPKSAECGGGQPRKDCSASPNSYSRVVQIPQVKLQVPFAYTVNPFTQARNIGGTNTNSVSFGGNLWFRTGQVRFDGVQMTDQGSAVTSSGVAARYVGYYEFTATPTEFLHQVPYWDDGAKQWHLSLEKQNINIYGGWSSLASLGL